MKKLLILGGWMLLATAAIASPRMGHVITPISSLQGGFSNPPIVFYNQGSLLGVSFSFNCSTGTSCSFINGQMTITATGSGGSGCIPAGSSGKVLLDSGSGTCNDSSAATDNGTTFSYTGTGGVSSPILTSTIAIGTAPLVVTSTTPVANLSIGGNAATATSAAKWTTARNLAGNSVDGSANVAFTNKFIVQGTTDAGLTGAQFLGALGTGPLKNTTTTGVLSIAAAADIYALWSGTCSSSTFLRGDGACATASGSTGISGLTLGFIPLAGSATTLTANSHLDDGITTASTITSSEPIVATSFSTASAATSGYFQCTQGTANGHATANTITLECPAAVTAYEKIMPGAAATGIERTSNSSGVVTESISELSGDATTSGSNAVTVVKINGTAFSGLASGILYNTTATGVPSIATQAQFTSAMAAQYKTFECEAGLGDGLNAIPAGTYLQTTCYNGTGVTITITGVKGFVDAGTASTLGASGHTLGNLVNATNFTIGTAATYISATQSANVALTSNDYIQFTFIADGTAKQTDWVVTGTY